MSITNLKTIVEDCYENGQHWFQTFRKVMPLATTAGYVADLSMGTGNPRPNYYTGDPLEAKAFTSAYGIWHGGNVSPAIKHLHKISVMSPGAGFAQCNFILCDYLLFYPLIDGDNTEEQTLTNAVTLPRYMDGVGVKAMLVATNPYVGSADFYINYTNHLGVAGNVSRLNTVNALAAIGTIATSGINNSVRATGPWIELQKNDGIRSVQSITFPTPAGGLYSLVLMVPIVEVYMMDASAPAEWDLFTMMGGKLPRIYDGAYLNFLIKPNATVAGQFVIGDIQTIWN